MPIALTDRDPRVSPDEVVAALVPPPAFAEVSFESYQPDPDEPSQHVAVERVSEFASTVTDRRPRRSRLRRRRTNGTGPSGLYLDGGFGVGKTHLLAALWHSVEGPKLFATFVELTHLVGALGFADAVARLSTYRLVCIDEFELDDPGDTVLVSTLLTRLTENGVTVAASSNTLPDQLGEGRFAADDFLREIQALAQRFSVVRIDGPDYRHRDLSHAAEPYDDEALARIAATAPRASLDHFVDLCRHLETIHPSRFGALLDGVGLACLQEVRPLRDQAVALRLVVFVDRLYDRGVPVAASGHPLDRVFTSEMLTGGFRKKYFRALSRLAALSLGMPQPRHDP